MEGYILFVAAAMIFGQSLKVTISIALLFIGTGIITPWNDLQALAHKEKAAIQSHVRVVTSSTLDLEYKEMAVRTAQKHAIDPELFKALIKQESAWNKHIISPKGATGLTQLMPTTAKEHCGLEPVDLVDAEKNIDCGASYFAAQLKRFGSVELALAAYNSGPERVAKLGRVPRIKETQRYVERIIGDWKASKTGV